MASSAFEFESERKEKEKRKSSQDFLALGRKAEGSWHDLKKLLFCLHLLYIAGKTLVNWSVCGSSTVPFHTHCLLLSAGDIVLVCKATPEGPEERICL